MFTLLALGAALDQFWIAYDILAILTLLLIGRMLFESACAMAAIQRVLNRGFKGGK